MNPNTNCPLVSRVTQITKQKIYKKVKLTKPNL